MLEVQQHAVLGEELELTTFCGGIGARWAERRVIVRGSLGAHMEAVTLWVHVDERGRPALLGPQFLELYGEAAGGRTVRARLTHEDPPGDCALIELWPLRFVDFDVMGHVNNAVYWAVVEEYLARFRARGEPMAPAFRAEMEFRGGIEREAHVGVIDLAGDSYLALWLMLGDGTIVASATVGAR